MGSHRESDSVFGPQEVRDAESIRERWIQPVVTVLLLALVWGAFVELSLHERRQTLANAAVRNENLALALEQYAIRIFKNAEAVTQFVATTYGRGTRGDALSQVLRERAENNDAFTEVLILEPGGELRLSSAIPSLLRDGGAGFPADIAAGATLVMGKPVAAPAGGRQLIPLLRPVRSDAGDLEIWVGVLVDSARFVGLLDRARLPEDTLVVMAGSDGIVYAGWGSQGRPELAGPLEQLDGRVRLVTVRGFAEYPLKAVVGSSTEDALSQYHGRRNRYLGVCVAVTALAIWLSLRLMRIQRRRGEVARRLVAANTGLEAEVAQRTGELHEAIRDIESFSYSVAHDLRAPLSAIDGFSQALEPAIAKAGDAKLNHYLVRIRENAARMGEITDGLLTLAKLGRRQAAAAPVDLTALAREVLATLQERHPRPEMLSTVQPGLAAIGDAALLRQVLENLLGNAWKFLAHTPSPQIVVGAGPEPASALLQDFFVRDNGPGFDMEHAGRLFTPFHRLHSDKEFPGTGIGLAIVQKIIVLHGGQIRGEAAPGQGAVFYFSLPGATA